MKPFLCPSCNNPLDSDQQPATLADPKDRYWVFWCPNKRCPSDVAQWDGGSGPTQESAYRSLCAAVDHESEMLSETEEAMEDKKERDKEIMAERLGDRLDRGQ